LPENRFYRESKEYLKAAELLLEYWIKPSGSLHISAMMLV